MREVGRTVTDWLDAGHRVAVARVIEIKGFGAVPAGEVLAVRDDGERVGSLLRGLADPVIDGVVPAALGGEAAVVNAPIAESTAVEAGLACAGTARLLVHRTCARAPWALLADGVPVAFATTLSDGAEFVLGPDGAAVGSAGAEVPVGPDGNGNGDGSAGDADALAEARELLERGATGRIATAATLVDVWAPIPTVVTVGGGQLAAALAAQAGLLGWQARDVRTVDDAVTAALALGPADALVLFDHDSAMDAVLRAALERGHGFVGALGSRRTQASRRARLADAGVAPGDLDRIHGPVGLDLGARSPAETAVSIVAEVLATRSGRAGTALHRITAPIH